MNNYPFFLNRHIKALAAFMLFTGLDAHAESPGVNQSDEVVVTVTRTSKDPRSLPENIETISQKTIREESVDSISGLLDNASGVTIKGSGLWEAISTISGFGSNRVLVPIDGDREANLCAGRDPLTTFVDTGTIERIEILKGLPSVLYGSDALGGVINIITSKPAFSQSGTWTFKPSATISYSSNDNGKYGNLVLDGANESVALRLEASSHDHGSYKDATETRSPTASATNRMEPSRQASATSTRSRRI